MRSLRFGLVLAASTLVAPVVAEPLDPAKARAFVTGKLFAFNCFDGTNGMGRIQNDGSVAGRIRMQGTQPERSVALPPDTLRVRGDAICASLRGAAFEPCFDLVKTGAASFRGAVAGIPGMWCQFTRAGASRPGFADGPRSVAPPRAVATSAN